MIHLVLRTALVGLVAWGAAVSGFGEQAAKGADSSAQPAVCAAALLQRPIWVYNNWSAYDELSDRIPLTEELAMRELKQVERLRKFGAHFDYYVMDAFWFAPDGAYREWR